MSDTTSSEKESSLTDKPNTLTSGNAFPDRRQQPDRRGTGRQGKYDRRRNRCGNCQFFETTQKHCQFHQKAIAADDFACPSFQPI